MLPWWAYALSPRDQASDLIRIDNRYAVAIGATAATLVDIQLPPERISIITHFGIRGTGILQTAYRGHLTAVDPNTAAAPPHFRSFLIPFVMTGNASDTVSIFETNTYLIVPQGYILRANVQFTGGAAGNQAELSYSGWSIPKGNISQ